jgi:rare lipoprotein A (peptidoglycan hydrolase)
MIHSNPRLWRYNRLSLLALVALLAAFFAAGTASAPAGAASGGGLQLTSPSSKAPAAGTASRFGVRVLRQGMTGPDVKVLKGLVRSHELLTGTAVTSNFDRPTKRAVRKFQRRADMSTTGVVTRTTARELVSSMATSVASWYGPGLFGNTTACGQTLRPGTMGVAHKSLPCGSKVMIGYRGRFVITRVIDRGPYSHGRTWDLTQAVQQALHFDIGVGRVRHAVINRR